MPPSGSSAHAENAKLNPWTVIAEYEVAAEEAVAAVSGINPTTFRLPVVYGPGDQTGLMPRLVIAAVYKTLGQKMKVLWNDSTAVNTGPSAVDVCVCVCVCVCVRARACRLIRSAKEGDAEFVAGFFFLQLTVGISCNACNPVHVRDVVRAMWHAANADEATGKTYNLVDDNETTQEKIHDIIQSIFGIESSCLVLRPWWWW